MIGNFDRNNLSLSQKLEQLNWMLISMIITLAFIGFVMLYSAGGGSFHPWLIRQLGFFCLFFPLMLFIAITDICLLYRYAYFFYFAAVAMVATVSIMDHFSHNAMGATRWLKVGSLKIQPSELMKVCTVFALARYFSGIDSESIGKIRYIIPPILMIIVPVIFIFLQPDLGTAAILGMVGVLVLFIAGVKMWKFLSVGILMLITIPFFWMFFLHDYQKKRIFTFLNPDADPLGSGYNIIQSKIAIGSGGFFGKGLLSGTQGQLDFLPEKQTDFIFTMLAEELGFLGGVFTIGVYLAIILTCIKIAMEAKHQFGKLIILGVSGILFLHMFINMGMVMGIIPVVGAPLPFISYGGTIMGAMMIGFGMVLNVAANPAIDPKV